mgnify:CR=1 FL=1
MTELRMLLSQVEFGTSRFHQEKRTGKEFPTRTRYVQITLRHSGVSRRPYLPEFLVSEPKKTRDRITNKPFWSSSGQGARNGSKLDLAPDPDLGAQRAGRRPAKRCAIISLPVSRALTLSQLYFLYFLSQKSR